MKISRRSLIIILVGIAIAAIIGLVLLNNALTQVFETLNTGDCRSGAEVVVWNDTDRDGVRGAADAPLAGVTVRLFDRLRAQPNEPIATGVSGDDGVISLDVFIAGCPETDFGVAAQAPDGFCATTPEVLEEAPFAFGFAACDASDA